MKNRLLSNASPSNSFSIIDTHQLLFDKKKFSYSWCEDIPALKHSFLIEDYFKAIEGTNIKKSIFMESYADATHALAEARYVQALINQHSLISGIIAGGSPERESYQEYLEKLIQLPNVRGVRRVFRFLPDELFETQLFVENIRLLSKYGLTCDLAGFERQLPIAIRLIKQCPNVFFILNHCGEPNVLKHGLDPWKKAIKQVSEFPNVACKISSLLEYSMPDLLEIRDHVIGCFGWDRLVWGSDWPVCNIHKTLKQWVDIALELFGGHSSDNLHKLFYANAARIYRVYTETT